MRDLVAETSNEKLLSLDIADHKRLLFDALRAGNLAAIRNLFATNRTLLATKLGGYEGADVYETIPNVNLAHICHQFHVQHHSFCISFLFFSLSALVSHKEVLYVHRQGI
mgnify:CR=1 FL=1